MKRNRDKVITKPAYVLLYEKIRGDIVKGVYKNGEKLPSKRALSDRTGYSVITVEHAYGLLSDEGYIEARQRSGYFVIYLEKDTFRVPDEEIKDFRETLPSDNVSFPFSVFAKAVRSVISQKGDIILQKTENYGLKELRNSISGHLYRSRGIKVPYSRIIIGSGAEYLYGLIVELLGHDKIWGIEDPSYMKIEQVYRAKGVKLDHLKLGADGIATSELKRTKANVLHITPYRSFPSGVTATPSKRYEYIKWAERTSSFIVEDDFESEFTPLSKPEETLFSLSNHENVIYINTFSKTISSSLRVAYMVLPEKLFDEFEKKLGFYSCTVPTFEQYLISKLISEGSFERHINSVRRKRRREKNGRN